MDKFRQEGVPEGGVLDLAVHVTKIPAAKLDAVESAVRRLYDCSRIERGESGILFRKARITAFLKPMKFERGNLLQAARSLYRIILDHEVTVEITGA